ncbi:MAG: hypothetical protein M3162_03745 [Thermoproteota archaeon]|nr:hypothetical protein [Thermoproteota archaeon]
MRNFFSIYVENIPVPAFLAVTLYIIITGALLSTNPDKVNPQASSMFQQVFAQDYFDTKNIVTTTTTTTTTTAANTNDPMVSGNSSNDTITNNHKKADPIPIMASGHFANNQIKDGVVTWIQGGYWDLQIQNTSTGTNITQGIINNDSDSKLHQASFLANFTMIRPDGSLSHNHIINNFSSDNVILTGNDIVITGTADIGSDYGLEYNQVPLIVHLMGKRVLGLTIDTSKTEGHFESSNEMFGTLISGVGINTATSTTNTNTNTNTNNTAATATTILPSQLLHSTHPKH